MNNSFFVVKGGSEFGFSFKFSGEVYNGDFIYYDFGFGVCGFDDSGFDYIDNIVVFFYLMMGI